LQYIDDHATQHKLSTKQTKFFFKPWITHGIKHSIKTKNNLYEILCKKYHENPYFDKNKQYNKVLTQVNKSVKTGLLQRKVFTI